MQNKIFYKQSDGTVGLLNPAENVDLFTVIEELDIKEYVVLNTNMDPSDQDLFWFFDALSISGSDLTFDIAKAREIAKNAIRRSRKEKFELNDLALRDAMLSGDVTQLNLAVEERDRLRNLTDIVDDASTTQELITLIEENNG